MRRADPGAVALVTGCSSGFGLLICVELALRGFTVIAGMRRPEAKGKLMDAAQEAGVAEHVHVIELDVTLEEQVKQVVELIHERYGRIDVLVNNAGTAYGGFIEAIPLEVWREQMDANFIGVVSVTQTVLPLMREQQKGRIIQMSSISGIMGFPGFGPYASSKFALEGFSECLALEMKPFGIDVILIEPGSYGTPIWDKGFSQMSTKDNSPYRGMLEKVMTFSKQSAEQGGDPRDVARLVAYTALRRSPSMRYALPHATRMMIAVKILLPDRLFQRILSMVLWK
ncbi:SDR family oxidoreductase [Paenibacillus pini]|uniref:3-oxoacyl-[acyl-carrier protein] reductase n=1 Tax=Paenibacillus pini JCM 16418 TaxID=1236976 RepID=W7YCN5_9BACL|nr:SDR family oxidoreductase [Paenibacillus pini]GAF08665.1 3-oxoacyl-[acyl-carrier protein] reductase [Paenibacillus pini JCM 16418]